MIILMLFLVTAGVVGAWKYRENEILKKQYLLLTAEKERMEAIARTVREIENEEEEISALLGLTQNSEDDS
jgi:hypothetical protein